MMIKGSIRVAAITIFLFVCSFSAFADTINLYANLDDSNSVCNMLIDAMQNDSCYDPYNEYAVIRAGEYDYRIYFGKKLSENDLVYYRYTPQRTGVPASITRGTASSLTINKNGFYYVGNVEGSLASASAENYKVGVIVSIAVIIIVFFVLFRIFRKSEGSKVHYYRVR